MATGVALARGGHPHPHARGIQSRVAGAAGTADPIFPIPVNRAEPSKSAPQFGALERGEADADGWYNLHQEPEAAPYTVGDTGTSIIGGFGIKERLRIESRRQQ